MLALNCTDRKIEKYRNVPKCIGLVIWLDVFDLMDEQSELFTMGDLNVSECLKYSD